MIKQKVIENIGVICLDRPKQLNALSFDMLKIIKATLKKWEDDDNIKAVLFDSKLEKGFCAGGDLKEIYNDYLLNDECSDKISFFENEFELDKYILNYKKPVISHWRGVTMGGGVGLTVNSDIIIADETTNWAMPETMLGFTPDVGVGYHLSKFPQALGQYLALTGSSLGGSDLKTYGLADLYVESGDYEKIRENLFTLSKSYEGDELVKKFVESSRPLETDIGSSKINENIEKIDKYYSYDSFKEFYENLDMKQDDEFARECLEEISIRDPFMLNVQFEKYFIDKNHTPDQVFDLDLNILHYAIDQKSIHEGIRAKIIDKDNNPNWPIKSVEEVSIDEVKKLLGIDKTFHDRNRD